MPEVIPYILWAWVPVTLLLFWKLPPAQAAAASLIGGWLILPTAQFADKTATIAFPFWIMPACLPAEPWTTKARVVGLALLVGIMALDSQVWRRFRPSWLDLPALGWCLVPLASGLVNHASPVRALADACYLALAWGIPYLSGRLYFADPAGLTILARSVIAGGLCYVPFCLVEFVTGPIFYRILYGFHAYQFDGTARYIGFRPIVFLEHGNQLGTWMASSSLTALWLWRSGQLARFVRMPGSLVVSLLATTAVLTQSAGAVGLLVLGFLSMELLWRLDRRWPIVALMVIPLAFVAARATNLVDAKALAMKTSVGRKLVAASTRLDRQSFGWRLRVEERAARVALQKPVLGWSRWDWWREASAGERPWGLFSLVLGMYGGVGWVVLISLFAVPVVLFVNLGPPRHWVSPSRASAAALTGALLLNEFDAILNANLWLPILAVAGGLVGLRNHAAQASAWIQRAQATLR